MNSKIDTEREGEKEFNLIFLVSANLVRRDAVKPEVLN